ncbi:hypothetical protein B0T16DRAFT_453111 [Cercophora newfieldiana]|uniref:Arrestin C-terminal-like domain-containing protein n=1 Tax=Cercophora newfieldiana TaxID=92897 RepID=A0AA39YSA5_9PEZI|nr:hypothetical protein B0T16DRAFT_453111 [Cercophora newfieldiana]
MGPYQKPADNSAAASAPASSSTTSVSLEAPSASRSFFSRFSLPLRSRARNVADFHIRPADPHRKYAAGDHVQGAVILTVVKPVRITHLTVSLHGYVRVYKSPNGSANEPSVNPAEVPSVIGRAARSKNAGHGYASLFQDEQVLSSDGRLEPGRYEFNFDLLFPAKGLPSSIDFERGTISYMITATLTRPTSITPTTSCERKIYLVEKVDIGPVPLPRARTIYLEPISKRPKKKRPPGVERGPGSTASETTPEPASDMDSTRAHENSTEGSLSVVGEDVGQDSRFSSARSPVQSDMRSVSGESAASAGSGPTRAVEGNHAGVTNTSPGGTRQPHLKERTITATIELLRGGCLAGDLVPVKISVQHIRRIKSMHGVIVTLYRQGRIDSAPVLPDIRELTKEEAKRLEKEEYYPKSKTGLGGLSLSSAGSCSVFRKDLSQAFTPLIIDPATLTASVTTSVRVPEDVFPTIKGVPGEMITFKYNIEVIVDLGGKLASQIQTSKPTGARVGSTSAPLLVGNPYEAGAAALASWSTSIIDTDRLRREKGVISVVFELVVGTLDTSRLRGKSQLKLTPSIRSQTITVPENRGSSYEKGGLPKPVEEDEYEFDGYPHDYAPLPPLPGEQYPHWEPAPSAPISAPFYVPPPDVPDDSNLTEKDRIKRAEERLLPSQPPTVPIAGPSNPVVPAVENIYDADDQSPPPPLQGLLPPAEILSQPEAPSAPTLEDLTAGMTAPPTEDKQELERRRLLAEASAPPEFPEDYDNGGVGSSSSAAGPSAPPPTSVAFEPSAPVLAEEEDSYGPNFSYASVAGPSSSSQGVATEPRVQEPLPRYER